MHEVVDLIPGKYQCNLFNSFKLFNFILDLTDIGEGKHREEIWTYNKSEIANPS